jgi:solute carrier family 25 phosphate transporter 3
MPSLFPSPSALTATFAHASPFPQKETPRKDISHLYTSWSVSSDAKSRTTHLTSAAQAELTKASNAAQAKAGHIELYSAKYYATW